MSSISDLRLDWCSYAAAKYAVTHWHYSRAMPSSKLAKIGVWERGAFIGAVIFGTGANKHLSRPFGLGQMQACELVRVALTRHDAPVSRIVAIALRLLHRTMPGLRLVVSYADSAHGHHGGIYQAGGWLYLGAATDTRQIKVFGRLLHPRTTSERFGNCSVQWLRTHIDPKAARLNGPPKYRYVMPLDAAMRAQLTRLAQPYPKRERSRDGAAALPRAEGGSTPTRSLHADGVQHDARP